MAVKKIVKKVTKVEETVPEEKKVVKKTGTKKPAGKKTDWKEYDGELVDITPKDLYMVTLDVEETKFLLIYRDKKICVCMDISEGHETIMIPTDEFDSGEWSYSYTEKGKVHKNSTKVTVWKMGA